MNVDQAKIKKINGGQTWPPDDIKCLLNTSNYWQRAQTSPSCLAKVTGIGIGCFDNMLPKYVTSTDDSLPKLCPINKQLVAPD